MSWLSCNPVFQAFEISRLTDFFFFVFDTTLSRILFVKDFTSAGDVGNVFSFFVLAKRGPLVGDRKGEPTPDRSLEVTPASFSSSSLFSTLSSSPR
jgi:hypothetical protein